MDILFLADGRSPIALNWIRYFTAHGHRVHLVSLYPCEPALPLASLSVLPVAFSGAVAVSGAQRSTIQSRLKRAVATPAFRTWLRHRFVPRSLPRAAEDLRALVSALQPDVVHAMRIPYEGMLAALALAESDIPLLVSVWGNDFTLHAKATRRMAHLTRLTLRRADALHTDCRRDLTLARAWGFSREKPAVVLPGGGGVPMDLFHPPQGGAKTPGLVVNPRGLSAYVRNDTFFRAIPKVLAHRPEARFLCPAMANQPEAESWAARLGVGESLRLMPRLERAQMAEVFQQAEIVLSITEHDGTPNSLLEALACGCFPIVGDIPSLREWITEGEDGFLVPPDAPDALAEAVLRALSDEERRAQAADMNRRLIAARAEYATVMRKAETFYAHLRRAS